MRPRAVALAFLLVLLALGVALALPPARSAILDFLGIGGARIERVPVERRVPARPLVLGEPLALADAERRTPYRLLVPAFQADDRPVYVREPPPGGAVSFLAPDRRVVVTEFRAQTLAYIGKSVGPETRLEECASMDERVPGSRAHPTSSTTGIRRGPSWPRPCGSPETRSCGSKVR